MNGRQKTAVVLNILIFAFTVFATVSMIIGFYFMGEVKLLSSRNFHAFKYFTVDSNVFAGIISLVYLVIKLSPSGRKSLKISKVLYVLKLAAVTGVTLTMMVTVFFLAPRTTTTYFDYFKNSNFFMHFLTPVLCIISFVFFEPVEKASFPVSFAGIIPMVLYGFYYIPNVFLHLENGKPTHAYDWYGFLDGGMNTIWFVVPVVLLITWFFSVALWALNKKFAGKSGK